MSSSATARLESAPYDTASLILLEMAMMSALKQDEMGAALEAAGFYSISCFGDMTSAPFDAKTSGNLVVTVRLPLK